MPALLNRARMTTAPTGTGTIMFDCDDQVCACELDTGGSVLSPAGTLTVTINASGVFTLD